jgi:putative DNA primase/helicase
MAKLGTVEHPIESREPMKVARGVIAGLFTTETGNKGLWWYRGGWWTWRKGQWMREDGERVFNAVWRWCEDSFYEVRTAAGTTVKRVSPTLNMVGDVVAAMKSLCECPWTRMPVWTDKAERPPVERCVAFLDGVVDLETGVLMERGEEWLGPVVQAEVGESEAPERWLRAVQEWGVGDPAWASLLQRWMGYCLMNHRWYARWMLMEGKVRGGKGTIAGILRALLGESGFVGASLDDLAGGFGLEGLETARVLVVGEVSEMAKVEGGRAGRVIKNIVGRDAVSVNLKHQPILRNVVLDALPIVSANEIPEMPNKGQGLSSKMLVLPFAASFLGKEEFGLSERLEKELGGIAAWALQGARQLWEEKDPGKLWPEPTRAEQTKREYRLTNNPMDRFLEARFVKAPGEFVPGHIIRAEWDAWAKRVGFEEKVGWTRLLMKLERESTWGVERFREMKNGTTSTRGLKGLAVRRVADDEE